jgi:hypothetical protein
MREIHEHLSIDQYGNFTLTSAIRPSLDLQVIPRQGYRQEVFEDVRTGTKIPTLAAAVSQEYLFDVFMDLLDQLGDVVDVFIESHHERKVPADPSKDFLREHIDMPVLKSYFHEFRDLILDDGCLGLAVIDPRGPSEIQFDDHKVLVIYSRDLGKFAEVFERYGIERDDDLKLISEGEHLHSTAPTFSERIEAFRISLNAE